MTVQSDVSPTRRRWAKDCRAMLPTVAASTRRALAGTAVATGALTVGIVALVAAAPGLPLDAAVADWFGRTKVTWLLQTAATVRFVASQAPFVLTFAVGAVLWWREVGGQPRCCSWATSSQA